MGGAVCSVACSQEMGNKPQITPKANVLKKPQITQIAQILILFMICKICEICVICGSFILCTICGSFYSIFIFENQRSLKVMPIFRRKVFSVMRFSADRCCHWALTLRKERLL